MAAKDPTDPQPEEPSGDGREDRPLTREDWAWEAIRINPEYRSLAQKHGAAGGASARKAGGVELRRLAKPQRKAEDFGLSFFRTARYA